MILTDKEIREYVQSNSLIEGFKEESLQSESYDLTIGDVVSKFDSSFKILRLDQQEDIDSLYLESKLPDSGYLLGPHEYILVSIEEKINMPDNLTAHIRPRTKFTRLGLLISGQHCNSSYSGYLSLGLYNATPFAICIKPGLKIAQIVFEELRSIPSEQKQYDNKHNAAFQNEQAIQGSDFSKEPVRNLTSAGDLLRDLESNPAAKNAYEILVKGLRERE